MLPISTLLMFQSTSILFYFSDGINTVRKHIIIQAKPALQRPVITGSDYKTHFIFVLDIKNIITVGPCGGDKTKLLGNERTFQLQTDLREQTLSNVPGRSSNNSCHCSEKKFLFKSGVWICEVSL